MRTLWKRVLAVFRGARLDGELREEIASHLAMQEEEFRQRGMSPAEAHAAARREFGGVAQAAEAYRERRGLPWIDTTIRDLRHAVRGLRRSPGFTAAAVLSLAVGIGANAAIFSLFHAVLLRLLPVARPQELVSLYQSGGLIDGYSSYPLYQEIAKRTDLFSGTIARTNPARVRFRERAGARENFAVREFVSGNYFQVLGVQPAMGRLFTGDDNRVAGGHPLAVLSYECWRNRYGADPAVVGRTVLVDEKPLTVIGVGAAGFGGIQAERHTEVWVPILMAEANFQSASNWWLQIVGRARPGVPRGQMQAAVNVLMQQHLAAAYPTGSNAAMRKMTMGQRLTVRDGGIGLSMLRQEFARPLQVLMAAVGLVLLMACANVANLLLARGAARSKEVALRFSLGATRMRLVRQALTESLLLAAAGAVIGTGVGVWGTRALLRFLPEQAGNPWSATPEPVVLAFTIAISVFSVVLFGLAPALRSTAVHPAAGLRSEATGLAGTPILRRSLVVAQVAFSVVLVVMAGLFGRSLMELRSVDLGFRNQNVVVFNLDFPHEWQERDMREPYRQLSGQLRALPGVSAVSYGFPGPFHMGVSVTSLRVPGSERTANEPVKVDAAYLAPGYFEAIGTPLRVGREFDGSDIRGSRQAAVVNEAFVRAFLPGEAHPDRRFVSFDYSKPDGERTWIVGVVADIRHDGIQKRSQPTIYLPIEQGAKVTWPPTVLIRTDRPPATLLAAVSNETRKLGQSIVIEDFGTIRRRVDDSIFEQRLLALLSGLFGAVALVLAAVGLYGVVAYGTARRSGEIGIRIALGARRSQVLWMILRGALAMVSGGLAIGLMASMATARAVGSILFGIRPSDPAAFVFTAAVLAVTGVAAAFLPARRAASIDPMRALRHE